MGSQTYGIFTVLKTLPLAFLAKAGANQTHTHGGPLGYSMIARHKELV